MIKSHRPKNSRSPLSRLFTAFGRPHFVLLAASLFLLAIFFVKVVVVKAPSHQVISEQSTIQPVQDQPATPQEKTVIKINSVTLKGSTLYVNPNSNATRQAAESPNDPAQFKKLAQLPVAHWVTSQDSIGSIRPHLATAAKEGTVPVIVSYNFHKRDCGGYSAGGANSGEEYRNYIDELANELGDKKVVVILEPDALTQATAEDETGQPCLQGHEQDGRYQLLSYAAGKLGSLANTMVYIDAGNSRWVTDTDDMASRLQRSGIDKADGFSLNISNFIPTEETTEYGKAIAAKLGNKHFVIDTSRNGLGPYSNPNIPDFNWCNPPGRALGHYPTTNTGQDLIDAYLYIKYPGESDGTDPDPNKCFNGPKAGEWWPEYALGLIDRWPNHLQP